MFPTIPYKTKVALCGMPFLDFDPRQIAETPECCCFQEFPFCSVFFCSSFSALYCPADAKMKISPWDNGIILSYLILSHHCKQTRGKLGNY